MHISSRPATVDDIEELERMYGLLAEEQAALKPIWPFADGLAHPIAASLKDIVEDPDAVVEVGTIDDVPLGFIYASIDDLLPQAEGRTVGVFRLIFTELDARGVGVAAAMITAALARLRGRGIRLFDAHVSPGHRLAKNFFEANGFSARLIVMHHAEDPDEWSDEASGNESEL